jgi:hypothetical protein
MFVLTEDIDLFEQTSAIFAFIVLFAGVEYEAIA